MHLHLTEIGYFRPLANYVCIRDGNGIFYQPKNLPKFFSLPVGNYHSETPLAKIKPFKRKYPKLKKPNQLTHKFPNKFPPKLTFEFFDTHTKISKAGINLKTGKVYIKKDWFESLPTPQRDFVLFHEVGHYHYLEEENCDLFAQYQMLKKGYNYSQVANIATSLNGSKSSGRIFAAFENIINCTQK